MGIARSTFYADRAIADDTAIVEAIAAICAEFEFYGRRRVRAELRHRGRIVNHEKIRRRICLTFRADWTSVVRCR
jgi:putative transposase